MFGFLRQDLAIDLGSSHTRLLKSSAGGAGSTSLVLEPTVIAVRREDGQRKRILACGSEALAMYGRTPPEIDVLHPVQKGRIVDFELVEVQLAHMLRQLRFSRKPRIGIAISTDATDMEQRALRDCCEKIGTRGVHLFLRPLAAAVGLGLPIERPAGHMIIELGGGSTEISVISLSGIVSSMVLPGGGDGMNQAIIRYIKEEHLTLIGHMSAEHLKRELGAATTWNTDHKTSIKGRCLQTGIPRKITLSSAEVGEALRSPINAVINGVRRMLDRLPPELASDIVDRGCILTGGGSLLRDLDNVLRESTGLAVIRAEAPLSTVVQGVAGMLLTTTQKHKRSPMRAQSVSLASPTPITSPSAV